MAGDLSDDDIGLSDSDIGLTGDQPSDQAPTQAQGLSDSDIGLSDADIGLPSQDQGQQAPAPEGMVATAARAAAHSALPAAGGLVGAGLGGAAVGALGGGPIGAALGGIAGLILGSMGTDAVQQRALKSVGFDDSAQLAADAEANPYSEWVGGMIPALASMNPAAAGVSMAERAVGGAGMAGFEAGQEYLTNGKIDPVKVAAAGGAGALAPRLNAGGEHLLSTGSNLAGKVAGRPAASSNPDAGPAKDEAASSQQATATGDTSLQQQPSSEDGSTTGNPQSAPSRSDRTYPKEPPAGGSTPDMLTQGNFTPDVANALASSLDANDAPDLGPRPELPDGTANGVDQQNMTYKGEQLPVKTGFPEAQPTEPPAAAPVSAQPAENTAPNPVTAAPEAQPPAPPVVGQFQTSKGSTYDLHPDQTTTRNKAARPDPGHEGDEGPKPRSEKTYFLTKAQANALAPAENVNRVRIIDHNDGHLSTATPALGRPRGTFGISETQRHVGPVGTEPAEGLIPLEVWSGGPGRDGRSTGYNAYHFGNEITQLGQNGRKAPIPVRSDEALLDVSRTQRDAAAKQRNVGQDQEPGAPTLDTERSAAPQNVLSDEDIGLAPHPADAAREAAKDAAAEPTNPQKDAENYKMGHSRMFGRDISWENAKGSTRVAKDGSWKVDDLPYDYGRVRGTKGADGDHVDIANVGTGDKHFVIDQRNADTGKFDEHKIFANAKDEADAVDHYKRGFSDARGEDRLGAITEVSPYELKSWLQAPGAKKRPYSDDFVEPKQSGPTEGTKPVPKIVTAAVNALREKGFHDAAQKLLDMEPSARIAEANKFINKSDKVSTRPDRIRTPAPVVEGIKNNEGGTVTARSKADAAQKSADVKIMNDAHAKLGEMKIPETPEEKQELLGKLRTFMDETKGVTYRPALKHEPYIVARAAKKLLTAKNPTENGWKSFIADALIPDETRATNRIESDIGMNKRAGDAAIAGAEAKAAGTNDVEDQMIASIDAKRKPFDLDAEHTESDASPVPIKSAKDLERFDAKTEKLDMSKPADRARLSEETKKLTDNLIKQADRKAPVGASEDRPGSAGKKIDIKSVDTKAIMEAMAKAQKKTASDPHAVKLEELGAYDDKPTQKAKDLWDKFANDESGKLDLKKVAQDFRTVAKPQLKKLSELYRSVADVGHDVFGARTRNMHFIGDNTLKKEVAHTEKQLAEVAHKLDGHNDFWDARTDKQQRKFMDVIENQKGQALDPVRVRAELQSGVDAYSPEEARLAADHADAYKQLYNWLWQEDKLHGSNQNYVENYVPHLFTDDKVRGQAVTDWINEFNKRMGATWYQKNRLFDTIKEAEKAGFKLKYTNPVELLNARMNASLQGHLLVRSAQALSRDGLAVEATAATKNQERTFRKAVTLPDGKKWLIHPDAESLWKNALEDKGFQGMQNAAGSIYRNWMRYKRFSTPIQLSFSLFHEAHIMSISVANELSRALNNLIKGDSLSSTAGAAFKNIKTDLFETPIGKLADKMFGMQREHPGAVLQRNYREENQNLNGWDKMWNQLFVEAGTSPFQAREDVIGAKRDFAKAQREMRDTPGVGPGWRYVSSGLARGVEKSQEWMFKNQIPRLKAAALQRDILDAMRHNPDMITNPKMRVTVLQELAKNNDDKFGEKFYRGWFINKALKDTALASFVSAGWNVGQARQVGGAAMDATKMLGRWVNGDKRGPMQKARDDVSNKMSFVGSYVASTMLIAGGLSYALSGVAPTSVIDYLYPRNGHTNDDGTPARFSTPFNPREAVQLKAHVDAHNSLLGGIGEYIWNKTVLQPIVELAQNKNFYGDRIWDTNAPLYKQIMQGADATLGRMFNPISVTGAQRAYQQGGVRDAALAGVGFGPAPQYADQTARQRRIGHLYGEEGVSDVKPYEYGPKTGLGHGGVQDLIRSAVGDRTEAEARQKGRSDLLHDRATGDATGAAKAAQMLVTEGHVSPATVKAMQKGGKDTFQFSRLPAAEQIAQAKTMDDEEFKHYVLTNQNKGITKVARTVMLQQRNRNQ